MNLRHNQSLQVHEFIDQLSDTCNRLTNDYFTKLSLSIIQHCNAVKIIVLNHSDIMCGINFIELAKSSIPLCLSKNFANLLCIQ